MYGWANLSFYFCFRIVNIKTRMYICIYVQTLFTPFYDSFCYNSVAVTDVVAFDDDDDDDDAVLLVPVNVDLVYVSFSRANCVNCCLI